MGDITEYCPIPSIQRAYQQRQRGNRGHRRQQQQQQRNQVPQQTQSWREANKTDDDDDSDEYDVSISISSEDHFSDDISSNDYEHVDDHTDDDSEASWTDDDGEDSENSEDSEGSENSEDSEGSENSKDGEGSEDSTDSEDAALRDYLKNTGGKSLLSTEIDLDEDIIFARNIRGKSAQLLRKLKQDDHLDAAGSSSRMQRQEFSSAQRRLNRPWLLDLSRLHQNIVAFMSGRPQERSLPLGIIHRAVLKEIKRAAECYSLETSFNSLRNSGQEVAVTLRKTEISALPKARTRIYRRIEQECVDSDRDKQAALDMGFVDDGMSVVIRRPYGKQAGGVWSDEQGGGNNKKNKKNNNGRRRHQTGPSSGDDDGGDAGRQGSRRSGKKNKQKNTKRPTGNSGDAKSSSSTAGGGNRHGSVVGASAAPIDESNVGHRLLQKMGWAPGETLGSTSKEVGLKDPVTAVFRARGRGLGFDK